MSLDYSLSVDSIPQAWVPQVGDRVRIRLSAECRVKGSPNSHQRFLGVVGHFAEEEGIRGVVRRIEPDADLLALQGHKYVVHFPTRWIAGILVCCINFAASELEPLP